MYRLEKRALDVPFLFEGDDPNLSGASSVDLSSKVKTMLDVLVLGNGILSIKRADGVTRNLQRCYFSGGMGEQNYPDRHMKTVLSFVALDPFFYDQDPQEVTFTSGSVPTRLFFPVPPLILAPSAVFSEQTITNPGVQTWPVWTITGPGDSISLINNTSDRRFMWSGTLLEDDVLVIDTIPLYKTVRLNGSNSWDQVPVGYEDLWPLDAGANNVMVTIANSTAATTATCEYYPRYNSL
jgi:hypothetical protein